MILVAAADSITGGYQAHLRWNSNNMAELNVDDLVLFSNNFQVCKEMAECVLS